MKPSVTIGTATIMLSVALLFGTSYETVFAHGDDHHTSTILIDQDDLQTSTVEQLEEIVALLNQLVLLINALHIQQGYTYQPTNPTVTDDTEEMESHHMEHAPETTDAPENDEVVSVARLVIEIEPHNGKTHVHVRYVDKPEEMFFVESSIDNENGIVTEVHARTGLDESVVREALTYFQ